MVRKSKSSMVFILDLLMLYALFFFVYAQQSERLIIPISGFALMLFIALTWFVIALNSSIANVNIDCNLFEVLKDTFIGYSVLSAGVIGVVSLFGEFAPNNKLIL